MVPENVIASTDLGFLNIGERDKTAPWPCPLSTSRSPVYTKFRTHPFMVMKLNMRCSILFHLDVPGG
jgi:hypothetical protein